MGTPTAIPPLFDAKPAPRQRRAADSNGTAPHLTVDLSTGPVAVTVEDVDAGTARIWLQEFNGHNRTLQEDRVLALGRDMQSGDWLFNGDTIRFARDADGLSFLVDGQHRLAAIVATEITQPCLVVRGLPVAAQEVIDTGKVRTFGDTLKLDGWVSDNHVAAITRMMLLWDGRNTVLSVNNSPGQPGGGGGGAKALTTKPELYAYLREHKQEITDSLKVVHAMTGVGLRFAAAASKMAAAWVLCARRDPEAADLFIVEQVIRGRYLGDTDPASHLRTRLTRTDVYRPNSGTAFMLTLYAWNHFRKGTKLDRLQAPRVWQKPNDFPIF